jgi:hypothetical protein
MAIVPLGFVDKNDSYNYQRGMNRRAPGRRALRRHFSDGDQFVAPTEDGQSE